MSETTTTEPTPTFIVFNYVTSKIEQSETAPNFGDPNSALQAQASAAYGSTSGASSLGAAAPAGPTPATLGDPAAEAIAAAQRNLSPEQAQQVTAAFGSIGQVGQVPNMISTMHGHATNVLNNSTRVFDALDTVVRPEEASSANRCLSLTDVIGSIQGKFNSAISGVTAGLTRITNALISIPLTVINGVVAAARALTAAIASGISTAINAAIGAANSATGNFFTSAGSTVTGLFNGVGSAVTGVISGISNEIKNLATVMNSMINNPFRLVTPNVSPCLRSVFANSNSDYQPVRLTPAQIELRRVSAEISQQVAQFPTGS